MVKFPELQQKCVNPLPSMHNARVYIPLSSLFLAPILSLASFLPFLFLISLAPTFVGLISRPFPLFFWLQYVPLLLPFPFLFLVRAKGSSIEDLVLMRTKLLKWSSFYTKGLISPNYEISWDLKLCFSIINEET